MIQLPYSKATAFFLLGFFLIPCGIGAKMYFWDEPSLLRPGQQILGWNVMMAMGVGSLLAALQFLPLFRFKERKPVSVEKALLKIPVVGWAFWFLLGMALMLLFAGVLSLLDPAASPLIGLLVEGLGLTLGLIGLLNSNRILFRFDYESAKDLRERIRRQTTEGHFTYSEKGFGVQHKKVRFQADWEEIEGIIAYKSDSFTVDTIHLIVKTAEAEVNLHEDMEGWFAFKEKLAKHLPGIQSDWEWKVMFPPFEENITWVYQKGEDLG